LDGEIKILYWKSAAQEIAKGDESLEEEGTQKSKAMPLKIVSIHA
jgi:hypothetical protein